ncbi:deoxyribose-phosphate aldolase [Candidatus Gribaldobacteria bacterium]|nr:deoxyribose-phosphate aldolase [Candidatus Gribaldobacteria bacterium]
MTIKQIAKTIDHTNIDRKATAKDIRKTCQEAKKYGFRGVDVNPEWVSFVKGQLEGTDIKTVVLIDPPMGLSPHYKRVEMCKQAKKDGADELDVVINVIDVKYGRFDEVLDDLREICRILPTKIILGSGYLTDEEIKQASIIVKKAGAFCVKTATEKDPLDNSELKEKARHLKIMKQSSSGLKIKASGSIKTCKDTLMMLEAGADIIGTSSSVKIIQGCKKQSKISNRKL